MPPDEDNRPVNNNPYTNIGAGYSIFFAKFVITDINVFKHNLI